MLNSNDDKLTLPNFDMSKKICEKWLTF